MGPNSNVNNFFGIKVSKPGVNVNNAGANDLLYSNNYSQETFSAQEGNITFGIFKSAISGQTTAGLQITDSSGNVLFELDAQTWFWFDPNNGFVNVMQVGLLPDGSYGWAVATPGHNVSESF